MQTLEQERPSPAVAVLRLNRPEQRNALDTPTLEQLVAALRSLATDRDLCALVISTTSERALCAGADVAEPLDRAGGVARMERFAEMYAAIEAFPAVTICVCVGNCVGAGAEIVAGADLRVAGPNLKLAWAGARLGVPVGVARLVPLVGLARAKDLVFSGRTVGLDEARELGLVTRVAPEGEVEAVALALAGELAAYPAEGLRRLKGMFRDAEATSQRVATENEILVRWQREGAGLPSGRSE